MVFIEPVLNDDYPVLPVFSKKQLLRISSLTYNTKTVIFCMNAGSRRRLELQPPIPPSNYTVWRTSIHAFSVYLTGNSQSWSAGVVIPLLELLGLDDDLPGFRDQQLWLLCRKSIGRFIRFSGLLISATMLSANGDDIKKYKQKKKNCANKKIKSTSSWYMV